MHGYVLEKHEGVAPEIPGLPDGTGGGESGGSDAEPEFDPLDSPNSWSLDEVVAAIKAGLVPKELQKNYRGDVTRGEVAQMFINLIEIASGMTIDDFMLRRGVTINENAFSDTSDKAVLAANALNIINGVVLPEAGRPGRFDPGGTLNRAQIAAIINRVARVMGVATTGYAHGFTAVGSHWVDDELGWPASKDIIRGIGGDRFGPDGSLTTEQAIAITFRAIAALGGGGGDDGGRGGSGENEGDRGIDASRPVQPPQQSCASCLRATSMLIYRQTLFVDVELCRRRVSQLNY
jgi:hypothetical protein